MIVKFTTTSSLTAVKTALKKVGACGIRVMVSDGPGEWESDEAVTLRRELERVKALGFRLGMGGKE
jgi:hypothetical protein